MTMATFLDDPVQSGLLQFGLAMMAGAGPSPQKQSLGSIVGKAGLVGTKAYKDQQEFLDELEQRKIRRKLLEMQTRKIEQDVLNETQMDKWISDPANLMTIKPPQSEVGDFGPGEAPTVGPQESTMQPKDPRSIAMSMMRSGNPLLAKMAFAQLAKPGLMTVGNNLYDPEKGWIVPPQKDGDQWEQLDSRTPGGQLMQRNTRTGEIRPIGSGPLQPNAVSIQLEGRDNARKNVSGLVSTLQQYYDDLDAAGGAVKAGQSPVENAINLGMNSPPGQYLGRALGTQAQIARDGIAAMRPALINEIRQATGMSARAMDSNVELKFNIMMATDPGVDPSVNRAALERIDKAHGLGWGISSTPEGRNKLNNITKKSSSGANPLAEQGGLKRGQKVGDYVYLGGDPNNPSSWAKTP